MAKATAPLFSLGATGAFAKTMVFDRRGYVRKYVIPTNPKTSAQADIRIPFAGVAAVIKAMSDTAKADFKAYLESQGKQTYRWNAELISAVLANDGWNRHTAAFGSYTNDQQAAWDTNAHDRGVQPRQLDYGTTPDHYAGVSLFAVARTFHELGLGTGQLPAADNALAWAGYLLQG